MSVATFSKYLKVFSAEDNYSLPVSVKLSPSNQNHGRITWSGDGKWLSVTPLTDGFLPIFKYANNQLQPMKYVSLTKITSASFFNWTNRNITVGNEKGEVFVWDIKEKKVAAKVECVETHPVDFITVSSDDSYIASGSLTSNKICLHGLKTNKVVNTFPVPNSHYTSSLKFCMSKKNFLGASSMESTICVWDILRSEFVFKTLKSHSGACSDISFSPVNFQVIASVSLTKTLKIYDLREGKMVLDHKFDDPLNCVDIILNGDKVAMGTTGGQVIIYDLRSDKIFQNFKAHDGPVLCVKTQNLKIPKSYQEIEMNTPDQVDNVTKTYDISTIDIYSPIACNNGKDTSSNDYANHSKVVSFQSTPKILINTSDFPCTYEDSFLKKVSSPLPLTLMPSSQSSPYLCQINENPDLETESHNSNFVNHVKEEVKSELVTSNLDNCGDGFHVDDLKQRNVYYSDIITEIRNGQKEVLNEISLIRKEVNDMKKEFNEKFTILQENCQLLAKFLIEDIKQEIYSGNCESKLEHVSHRILVNELNDLILLNGEKVCEQIKLNGARLKHIFDLLGSVK